jgi:hypothetical protein
MKITNVRAGFATNSSSIHSFIMMTDGKKATSDLAGYLDYGREQFTLAGVGNCIKKAYTAW